MGCDSCQADAPVTEITDMFGNTGNVCEPCRIAMEGDACISCGS